MTIASRIIEFPKTAQAMLVGVVFAAVVGIDSVTVNEMSMKLLYLLPVMLAAWMWSRNVGLAMVVVCTATRSLVEWSNAIGPVPPTIEVWNIITRFGVLSIVVLLIAELKDALAARDAVIRELQAHLDNTKTFTGIRPICHSCRRIRDEADHWIGVEEFLRKESDIELTSSVCPECSAIPTQARTSAESQLTP